jgi:orotidine-5'-phosphate decarboxylase
MSARPSPVIVALDYPDAASALDLADRLAPASCRLKVGLELYTAAGPAIVEQLMRRGFDVFLDLKFHDIPNTVAGACRSAAELGVWMINVHALGGRRMLEAAREAVDRATNRPKLIAVTVLTSHAEGELGELAIAGNAAELVTRYAGLAAEAGLDGVVCSPLEAAMLRLQRGPDFLLVTPGVRPAGSDTADQRRVMTPQDALNAGASYLVIGRPVTAAADPAAALTAILDSLSNG